MGRLFLVFIVLLSQPFNRIGSFSDETDSDIPSFEQFVQLIDIICGSDDTCNQVCCKLMEFHDLAERKCPTEVDGQLTEHSLKRVAPFSKVHRDSCKSVCSSFTFNRMRISNQYLLLTYNNTSYNEENLCSNFTDVCYNYTIKHLNNLTENIDTDYLWDILVPMSMVGFAILLMTFTFCLYLLVPKLRNKIQNKCFLFHLGSRILLLCTFLIITYPRSGNESCFTVAFIHQFAGLATSFWLNVICLHLWRSIRAIIPPNRSSTEIICRYSLYAWGCSFLITTVTHLADRYLPVNSSLRPDIELGCCIRPYKNEGNPWFQPMFIYYHSIEATLQIINLCAFFHIGYTISPLNRVSKSKESEHLRRHQIKKLGILAYLKLFLYMGFIRILNMFLHYYGTNNMTKTTECILNAFFIFLIFVCNRRVLRLTEKRFSEVRMICFSTSYRAN